MSEDIKFGKVEVRGRVELGAPLEWTQTDRKSAGAQGQFVHAAGGNPLDYDDIDPELSGAFGERLSDDLELTGKPPIAMEDDGLVASYGIFGAPGAGKTKLLVDQLLGQVLGLSKDDPARRYGALILDPKAALIDDVTRMCREAGRLDDLVVINTDVLNAAGRSHHVNVIDCTLDPHELGALLTLAGRASGIDARDPFWFIEWANLMSAGLAVLRAEAALTHAKAQLNADAAGRGSAKLLAKGQPAPVTLAQLATALLESDPSSVPGEDGGRPRRQIEAIAERVLSERDLLPRALADDLALDAAALSRFFSQERYVGTIEAFLSRAYGGFRRSRLACYSAAHRGRGGQPFYEDILENGKIVLVSVSPSEPALAKVLCTLIKCIFQRTVLARGELLRSGVLTNAVRPVLMACDEYSEIASEVPGQSMGDGQFLALARQYGCMALLATQSVNVLEASSLGTNWRSVASNFGAKIYMRLADAETAEAASILSGDADWRLSLHSDNVGAGGGTRGTSTDLRERRALPPRVLTQLLRRGEAVMVGSLDGGKTRPRTVFFRVPHHGPAQSAQEGGDGER